MTRKVMIITDQLPGHEIGFERSGHAHYLSSFIAHFSKRSFDVSLVALSPKLDFLTLPASDLPYRLSSPALGTFNGRLFVRSPRILAGSLAWFAYSVLPRPVQLLVGKVRLSLRKARGFVHSLGTFRSSQEVAFAQRAALREQPDIILYDGIFNYCGPIPGVDQWIITHEVKHERASSFAESGFDVRPTNFNAQAERSILEEAGNVVAIQWDDAKEFRRLAPASRIVVVPAAVDVPARSNRRLADTATCLFVGSGSFHNYHGLSWFLDECWPRILSVMPSATLDVCGSVCLRLERVPKGVTLRGVVDDLRSAYQGASLALVPLQVGSGLKVKLIEALAYGLPVVTTSVGAQGLLDFQPRPFIIADSPADFVEQTLRLLGSPELRRELTAKARKCAELFTPDAAFAQFQDATSQQANSISIPPAAAGSISGA
jgi:glycosyltransferase involved in cell wall biosynthesis